MSKKKEKELAQCVRCEKDIVDFKKLNCKMPVTCGNNYGFMCNDCEKAVNRILKRLQR
jgi:hypothetical protein